MFRVTVGLGSTTIDRQVFVSLFDNSVVRHRADYLKALRANSIQFNTLVDLARKADIPYPLFFAPSDIVRTQIASKTDKLLQGVTKEQFSMNARGTVELADIELIVKDLLRKQDMMRKQDPRLPRNPLVGRLHRRGTPAHDARTLLSELGLTTSMLHSTSNKQAAVELIIEHLEYRNVLVARSVNGYMPQTLTNMTFSGITIRDNKVPYIFLAGGSHGEHDEPTGRQLFTLTLLTVLVARRVFAPVTMDARTVLDAPPHEYEITAEALMPSQLMHPRDLTTLEAIRTAADDFKVTPSALVVRAHSLRILDRDTANQYLDDQAAAWRARPKTRASAPKPVNALRKYNGRKLTRTMLGAIEDGTMSPKQFCRVVCANKIAPDQIDELRAAVR